LIGGREPKQIFIVGANLPFDVPLWCWKASHPLTVAAAVGNEPL
jgi:hypothetical protein